MTIVSVVQETCAVVGVENPGTSVFTNINTNRTMFEMVALANEMSQRIAYDFRDWTVFRNVATIVGDGTTTAFTLPANFKRMLLTTQMRSAAAPRQPLRFVPDFDEWMMRRLSNQTDAWGEWTIAGGFIHVDPAPAAGALLKYVYLDKDCVDLESGGNGDRFSRDYDKFRLDERVLRLGMIWQWKAQKGSPYAEDMGTYSDALAMLAGKDSPAPIYVGSQNISAAVRTAYPGPLDPAGWTWPLQ